MYTNACRVEKLVYYKESDNTAHEYLLAKIKHEPSQANRWTRNSPSSSSSTLVSNAENPSVAPLVDDRVRIGRNRANVMHSPADKVLATMSFNRRFPLLDFALVIQAVLQQPEASLYDASLHQCRWFAESVWKVVLAGLREFGPQIKERSGWRKREMHNGFRIQTATKETLAASVKTYQEVIVEEHKKIAERREIEEGERRQRKEEAFRKLKEAVAQTEKERPELEAKRHELEAGREELEAQKQVLEAKRHELEAGRQEMAAEIERLKLQLQTRKAGLSGV